MENFKFNFNNREYILGEDNLEYFEFLDEAIVNGFDSSTLLSLINNGSVIDFTKEYYDAPCENCLFKDNPKKIYSFLEYHFYIFTKDGDYILSSLSEGYEESTLEYSLKSKTINDSFLVSIAVCPNCGNYSVEIESDHK